MYKKFIICLIVVVFSSCIKNDPTGKCQGFIDYGVPSLFLIELVDSVGNNLIETGFYVEEQVSARLNGALLSEDLINTTQTDVQNVITLFPVGNEGPNQYLIDLSATDTDTLDFTLEFIEIEQLIDGSLFCGTKPELTSVNYNQNEIDISSISKDTLTPLTITVLKNTN